MNQRIIYAVLVVMPLAAPAAAEPMRAAQGHHDAPPSVIYYEAGPSVIYSPVPPESVTNATPAAVDAAPPSIIRADSPNEMEVPSATKRRFAPVPGSVETQMLPPPPERFPRRGPSIAVRNTSVERVVAMQKQPPLPRPRPRLAGDASPKPTPIPRKQDNEWLLH
jgi:hypothetical protein